MLGAIAGDMIGAPYEGAPCQNENFPLFSEQSRFTDDSVLTVATAEVLLDGGDYASAYRKYGRLYPNAGYGGNFIHWIFDDGVGPYNSWGNGSAMRVSPVGWWGDSLEAVLDEAARSASVTHNHPEGFMASCLGTKQVNQLSNAHYNMPFCIATFIATFLKKMDFPKIWIVEYQCFMNPESGPS